MINLICDKCGCDCELNAFVITNELINNPNPVSYKSMGNISISSINFQYKLMLCQKCYAELNLPNYFMVKDNGKKYIDEHFKEEKKHKQMKCSNCFKEDLCKLKSEIYPDIEFCSWFGEKKEEF